MSDAGAIGSGSLGAMGATAIEVSELEVVRGGRRVLPGLSLRVEPGTVTGLLGPSGSGKTTLIRSIVGVQIVRSGAVRVLGEPAGSPSLRSRVAYTTQAPSVYGDLSVRENLRYFARVLGAPADRVQEVVESVRLTDHAESLARNLSGGQLARASLATALLGEPELLVLDEPTVGLDPVLRMELWAMFRELAERGATLLVSSHVMEEAGHCDRLLLLREGRIVASETPEQLLAETGTADLEAAFLELIRRRGAGE